MRIEWDEDKNLSNQQKHDGLSFDTAVQVFADEFCIFAKDRIDDETGEQRWHGIGRAGALSVHVVVHVYREGDDNGEEIIRIISARTASKRESRRYFQKTTF